MNLTVSISVDASPEAVWGHLEDIASHTDWMADALSIGFLTEQRQGVGTRFACRTRVAFLTTTDLMEITEWVPQVAMGVRHSGAVSGEGRFELLGRPPGGATTVLTWNERLRFPWWMGGPVGGVLARPLLQLIWRGNLSRLQHKVETATTPR